jgi:hypothetical protein
VWWIKANLLTMPCSSESKMTFSCYGVVSGIAENVSRGTHGGGGVWQWRGGLRRYVVCTVGPDGTGGDIVDMKGIQNQLVGIVYIVS